MSDTSEFLYRLQVTRPGMLSEGPTPQERATVGQHFAYLEALTAQGVVLFAGRTATTGPETFGLVVLRAVSTDAARRLMEDDPAVRGKIMQAELFPFRVALMGRRDGAT